MFLSSFFCLLLVGGLEAFPETGVKSLGMADLQRAQTPSLNIYFRICFLWLVFSHHRVGSLDQVVCSGGQGCCAAQLLLLAPFRALCSLRPIVGSY